MGKIVTLIFGLAVIVTGVVIAESEGAEKVFAVTVQIFGALLSPIAIPLMFGMLFRSRPPEARLLALLGGLLTYGILVQFTDDFAIYTGGEILVGLCLYFGEGWLGKRPPAKEDEVERLFDKLTS